MSTINLKRFLKLLIGVSLILGFSTNAFAVGTPSGTQVDNQATITFSVGGVAQVPVTSDDPNQGGANDATSFIVDTKIDVTVAWQDASNVQVAAGQDGVTPVPNPPAVLMFLVTNEGNAAVQDFQLSTENIAGDDFDPTAVSIFVDSNANNTYEPGVDTATFIDELSSTVGANSITVFVVGSVAATQTNGQTSDIALVATAHDGGAVGLGGLTTEDVGNDTALGAPQVAFADAAGTAVVDIVTDGEHSDTGTYVVVTTSVTVNKTSQVTDDGVGGTAPTAKAIPGATVTYTISIANTGTQVATGIAATDPIDVTNLTYVGNVTFDVGCGGATSSSFTSPNFTFNVPTIAAGATCNVTFDVIIN